jgi:hypothetical protein
MRAKYKKEMYIATHYTLHKNEDQGNIATRRKDNTKP